MAIKEVKQKLNELVDEATQTIRKSQLDSRDHIWGYACLHVCNQMIDSLGDAKNEKAVIPKFAADIIKLDCEGGTASPNAIDLFERLTANEFDIDFHEEKATDRTLDWLQDSKNLKTFIDAFDNGYEVEKEKKYLVKIKGIGLEEEWLNCEVGGDTLYFELNSSTESEIYKTNFTKQWLKDNFPEYDTYNNAGLLEFEEVEDD